MVIERGEAVEMDAADPLAAWRERFVTPEGLVYLDGNSLGMAPRAALDVLAAVAGEEWADGLIRSWDHWVDLPSRVGDRLSPIIGAPAGSVVVHDSTTVNLHQLVHAALALAAERGRPPVIAVPSEDFPTDRYVVAGIARATGGRVVSGLDDLDDVGVVVRSLVDYRTAELADLAAETDAPPPAPSRCGISRTPPAPSRSTSSAPASSWPSAAPTSTSTADPALRRGRTPPPRSPAGSTSRCGGGSPSATSSRWATATSRTATCAGCCWARRGSSGWPRAEVGIGHVADAGMAAVAAKGSALTELALALCAELGLPSPTPRDPARRGAHVAVRVADADAVHTELTRRGVITDVRRPDIIRVGCAALTTRFVDVWDGSARRRRRCRRTVTRRGCRA